MNKEKQYLLLIGDKRIFCDTEKEVFEHTKTLKTYEYMLYGRLN